MKKTIIMGLLFFVSNSFAQVNKVDFETIFSKFKFDGMSSIYLKNVRTYYVNGTSSLEQTEYKAGYFTYELKDNAIYLISYEDPTKAKLNNYMIIPYKSIQRLSAGSKGFTIELNE